MTPNLLYAAPALIPEIITLGTAVVATARRTRHLPWVRTLLWAVLLFPFANLRNFAFRLGHSSTFTNAANGFILNLSLF